MRQNQPDTAIFKEKLNKKLLNFTLFLKMLKYSMKISPQTQKIQSQLLFKSLSCTNPQIFFLISIFKTMKRKIYA